MSGASLSRDAMDVSEFIPGTDLDEMFMVWARVDRWCLKYFDKVIGKIAQDRESLIIYVAPTSKHIFCSYYGGMDLFAEEGLIRELSATYSKWKSERSDGL